MTPIERRNLIAQWAFDTRPVLLRFHLWLEDVEVERAQPEPVSEHAFTPRGIARSFAMTSAATALGTRLFGGFGEGAGKDKAALNQVKKSADAISAYVMSEGLWHLTRALPENHAIMVSLGEGLMPKAGETPEMGANPLLGFGRVYARPEVARIVDRRVRRLLNEPGHTFDHFYGWLQGRGITIWGAAVDTLENTSRFAEGKATGPMSVCHLFDSPLVLSRPYESYMGCLTVPRRVAEAADRASLLLDYRTPRVQVVQAIESAYPGLRRENIHVWTLRGKSRVGRLGKLWEEWAALGVHLVEDGWAPRETRTFSSATATRPRPRRCRRPASPRYWTSTPRWRSSPPASSFRATSRGGSCSSTPTRPILRRESARRSAGGTSRRAESSRTRRRSARREPPTSRSAAARSSPATSSPRRTGGCWRAPATSATTRTRERPASRASPTGFTA